MKRTSVAFLITGLNHGGAETQLFRLATGLRARGWNVDVVSLLGPGPFSEPLKENGIRVWHLGAARGRLDFEAIIRLYRLLVRLQPDVLVTFMYHANVLGRLAGRLAGVPVIIGSIRNERFGGRWRERLERWTERFSDYTTTNSHLAARSLVERGVVRPGRLRVIPNGIPMGEVSAGRKSSSALLRADLGIPHNAFLWLAVGHLEDQKDYPTLFEACRALQGSGGPTRLLVAGEGSQHSALSDLIRGSHLKDWVQLLGMRRDVPSLLETADGYVLSSAWEGMPNALMEALVAARPVVATQVGGVPELVQEGVSGFLVPARNPVALADAMRRMSELPLAAREAMGMNGRRYVERHYDADRVMGVWDDFLSSLLPERFTAGASSKS